MKMSKEYLYKEHVKEVFLLHHDCMGMDSEEAEEIYNENNFSKIEKWLTKIGYDLEGDFKSNFDL